MTRVTDMPPVMDFSPAGKHATGIHTVVTPVHPHTVCGHVLQKHVMLHGALSPVLLLTRAWVRVQQRARPPVKPVQVKDSPVMLHRARVRVLPVTSLPALTRAGIRAKDRRAGIRAGLPALRRARSLVYREIHFFFFLFCYSDQK